MRQLSRMLTAVIHSKPSSQTVRKMIILKDRKSYENCVKVLTKQGITPVKQVAKANMVCCHLDQDISIQDLLHHPSIKRVETDVLVHTHAAPFQLQAPTEEISSNQFQQHHYPWGVTAVHAPSVWPRAKGRGIKVGVLDTGISPHPDLRIAGGINTIKRDSSYKDDNGHGTHVAGTIAGLGKSRLPYGVAPQVSLYAIKALDEKGDGFVSDIVEGIEWCIAQNMNIINMSLGLDGPSDSLHASIRRAHRRGIVIIASAGNSGPDNLTIDAPALYHETIAVAASDKKGQIAEFSSRGKGIDITAPGVDIVSTNNKQGLSIDSGTSMAAPHVTGTVALMLQLNPALGPDQVRTIIMSTAHHLKGYNNRSEGHGLVDAKLAVRAAMKSNVTKRRPLVPALRRRTTPPALPEHSMAAASSKRTGAGAVRQRNRRRLQSKRIEALVRTSAHNLQRLSRQSRK
ncbi:S8 family peptidase [Paenibacillus taiwanensis]|uniref:S8 family peptidase n=1 Tax=Paenibacillus taiwanensis TaxID=401638 RepID=UPI0004056546|nr:S8 family peptidase [Paenibacillus taiwanensis]